MKIIFKINIFFIITIIIGCGGGSPVTGELEGVKNRPAFHENEPHGMLFIKQGSYNMGASDQDVAWAMTSQSKTVSVDPFWMDETEITNNEYREFVFWVRDSIARRMLGEDLSDKYLITEDALGNEIDPPFLNWEQPIEWDGEEEIAILDPEEGGGLFLPKDERFFRRKEIDSRKLIYSYDWINLKQAAKKSNRYDFKTGKYNGEIIDLNGNRNPIEGRKSFIFKDQIEVYPDTLCWMSDFTYAYNEPWTNLYFWHPAYDEYPVVGVNWKQATAFSIWRTRLHNNYLYALGEQDMQAYRLPTESEWEYAARGGLALSMYPWGGPYTRNYSGCFIANFKPLRGNYVDDGGIRTLQVTTYDPNEFGLYDMAGNVAEWTSNAFDESAYSFIHDLSPNYEYNAIPDDPPALKRKVVRGGSWKDIAYYLQTGTRTYEYQDTSKCYIGFRCVRSYMGRDRNDWDNSRFY